MHLVDDSPSLAAAAAALAGAPVVGLDCEWRPFRGGELPTRVALLQVGTADGAFLFDLVRLFGGAPGGAPGLPAGGPAEATCPAARALLGGLLADPAVAKVGFGFSEDLRRLRESYPGWDLPATVPSLRELRPPRGGGGGGASSSLSALVCLHLGRPLDKRMQTSDWQRRPLSPDQLAYAAVDACCLVALARALDAEGAVAGPEGAAAGRRGASSQ